MDSIHEYGFLLGCYKVFTSMLFTTSYKYNHNYLLYRTMDKYILLNSSLIIYIVYINNDLGDLG